MTRLVSTHVSQYLGGFCTDWLSSDILLLGEASDAVCGDCCNRFYAMAHELHYGLGMEGHVDPGQYQLKV